MKKKPDKIAISLNIVGIIAGLFFILLFTIGGDGFTLWVGIVITAGSAYQLWRNINVKVNE